MRIILERAGEIEEHFEKIFAEEDTEAVPLPGEQDAGEDNRPEITADPTAKKP